MNTQNATTTETADELRDRMKRAFAFVDPAARATRLLGHTNHNVSWRDRISAIVLASELAAAGVSIEEVAESVVFFTATTATVTEERIGRVGRVDHHGAAGWLVLADGYRVGPAGDH